MKSKPEEPSDGSGTRRRTVAEQREDNAGGEEEWDGGGRRNPCVAPSRKAPKRDCEDDRGNQERGACHAADPAMTVRLPGRVLTSFVDPLAIEREEAFQEERHPQEGEDAGARAPHATR